MILTVYGMLAYRNPLGVLGTLSLDFRHYKTVNHKHNFRSHDAVCMSIILVPTPNCTKMLLDLNAAVILTSFFVI